MAGTFNFVPMGESFADDVGRPDDFVHVDDNFEVDLWMSMRPWNNPRENRCSAKDNTCSAFATKKSRNTAKPLCAGCEKKLEKAEA